MFRALQEILLDAYSQHRFLSTIGQLIFWKANQFWFHFPVIVSFPEGIKCICYPDSSYGGLVVYTRYPEPSLFTALKKHVHRSTTVIDVGANIGLVSLYASTLTKKTVHAFEADNRVFPRLKENIIFNQLENRIKPQFMAVSNKSGKLNFSQESQAEVSHLTYSTATSTTHTDQVTATTLDKYVKSHNIKGRLVVKIDVEGAELLVLKGMDKLLQSKRVSCILLEINLHCQNYGNTPQETVRYLLNKGYRLYDGETKLWLDGKTELPFRDRTALNVVVVQSLRRH